MVKYCGQYNLLLILWEKNSDRSEKIVTDSEIKDHKFVLNIAIPTLVTFLFWEFSQN